jgi:hypothetical protein
MSVTQEQLDHARQQIHALFSHRIEQVPDLLKDWYTANAPKAQAQQPEAYLWGQKSIKGAGTSQGRIDVYVNAHPGPVPFQDLLGNFFPDVVPRVVVVSRFRAVQGAESGAPVTLRNETGGRIALILQDTTGQTYALTCNHVLDAPPANQLVFTGSRQIGSLFTRVEIQYDPQAPPNMVDCALVKLNSAAGPANRSLPVGGDTSVAVARAVPGTRVGVAISPNNSTGTVEALADIEIDYPLHPGSRKTALFQGLLAITPDPGATNVVNGDSGSLVSVTDAPAGMVMAVADSAFTTDSPPVNLGQIAIACDLQKVIDILVQTGAVGPSLTVVQQSA